MYICRFIFTATGQVPSAMAGVAAHLTTAPSRPVLLHCLSDTGVMVYRLHSTAQWTVLV